MKSLILKILTLLAVLIPSGEIRGEGAARGLVLYVEPPRNWVNAAEFVTIANTSVAYTTLGLTNGQKEEIPRSGVLAVINYPPEVQSASFPNDAAAATRNIQALLSKYPQSAAKLNNAMSKWTNALAFYQQKQKAASAAPPAKPKLGTTLDIDGVKYSEAILTSFDGSSVGIDHSAGFARIPANKLKPEQIAALNATTASVRIDSSKIVAPTPSPAATAGIESSDAAKLRLEAIAAAESNRFQDALRIISEAIKADRQNPLLLKTLAVIGDAQTASLQLERAKADGMRIAAEVVRIRKNGAVTNRANPLNPNDSSGRQRSDAMRAQADQLEKNAKEAVTDAENHLRLALDAVVIESRTPMVASSAGVQSATEKTPVPKPGLELVTLPRPTIGMPIEAPTNQITSATKDSPVVNSLGMKFVPVPIIGGPTGGKRVLFSIWDTRVQDYAEYARAKGITPEKPRFEQGPTHPVVMVSWEDAKSFCAWLTARERVSGRIGGQDEYRLPSDHEWSCAVGIGQLEEAEVSIASKAGKIEGYPWGTQWPPPKGVGNYDPSLKVDEFEKTSAVGSFAANENGLYDMGGNVWQWCEDWYDAKHEDRVLRGASWIDSSEILLRSTFRIIVHPTLRLDDFGFRCVLAFSGDYDSKLAEVPSVPQPTPKEAPTNQMPGTRGLPPSDGTPGLIPGGAARFSNLRPWIDDAEVTPSFLSAADKISFRDSISAINRNLSEDSIFRKVWYGETTRKLIARGSLDGIPCIAVIEPASLRSDVKISESASERIAVSVSRKNDGKKIEVYIHSGKPPQHLDNLAFDAANASTQKSLAEAWELLIAIFDRSGTQHFPGAKIENQIATRPGPSNDSIIDEKHPGKSSSSYVFSINAILWLLGVIALLVGGIVARAITLKRRRRLSPTSNSQNQMRSISISRNGQDVGSFPEDQIPELIANCQLDTADYYWCEGMIEWLPLSDFPIPTLSDRAPATASPARTKYRVFLPVKLCIAAVFIGLVCFWVFHRHMISATKDAPFVNSLGMKFVPVPITGGPTDGRRVLFSVWDTRVQDYAEYAQANGITPEKPSFEQGSTHPVVGVTWDDAKAFCVWLTSKERASGRIGVKDEYRLPSDHEWSCAVGIGRLEKAEESLESKNGKIENLYPWGTQWPPPKGAGNYDPSLKVDEFEKTSAVGSFAANENGLYDMGGNVMQWCEDRYDGKHQDRVLRGGSWGDSFYIFLLSAYRAFDLPAHRIDNNGFRCVLVVSGG